MVELGSFQAEGFTDDPDKQSVIGMVERRPGQVIFQEVDRGGFWAVVYNSRFGDVALDIGEGGPVELVRDTAIERAVRAGIPFTELNGIRYKHAASNVPTASAA
jgi:hypothetical protein